MMIDFPQKFDGVINIITGLALIYYAVYMMVVEKNGGLRKRLMFLLTTVATLCLLRGANYLLDLGPTVEVIVLIISSIVPLALFLLLELMLRRHLPLPLKLFSGLSCIFLVIAFSIFGLSQFPLLCLMATYVITLISILGVLLTQKGFDLLPTEKTLIKMNMIIMILIVPLIVTDFKKMLGWDNGIRLGALGILFFLYALVKIWDNAEKGGFSQLLTLIFFNLLGSATICWLFNLFPYYFHVFILIVMLRMFTVIIIQSTESYSRKAQEMAHSIIDAFMKSDLNAELIKKEMSEKTFIFLTKSDLHLYKSERIKMAFKSGVLNFKNDLKSLTLDEDTHDEVMHIYEDFDCNACIYLEVPGGNFFLIIFKWPNMAPKNKLRKEVTLIQNLALKIRE